MTARGSERKYEKKKSVKTFFHFFVRVRISYSGMGIRLRESTVAENFQSLFSCLSAYFCFITYILAHRKPAMSAKMI